MPGVVLLLPFFLVFLVNSWVEEILGSDSYLTVPARFLTVPAWFATPACPERALEPDTRRGTKTTRTQLEQG